MRPCYVGKESQKYGIAPYFRHYTTADRTSVFDQIARAYYSALSNHLENAGRPAIRKVWFNMQASGAAFKVDEGHRIVVSSYLLLRRTEKSD